MVEIAYNVNNFNSKGGTAHEIREKNGNTVVSKCGVEFSATKTMENADPCEVRGKCQRCFD